MDTAKAGPPVLLLVSSLLLWDMNPSLQLAPPPHHMRRTQRLCAADALLADDDDIAETTFTVFAGDKRHDRQVRLVVRRVRPTPGSQLALFTAWDYHAFVTDRDLPLAEVEADHRRHAIMEQAIAELKSAGLAHLPSGNFMANAAWLALTFMAHNLVRAVGQLAGSDLERATASTLRRKVFTMPGRLVHTGRRRHLRLPASWPWADPILLALTRTTAIPLRC